MGKSAMSCFNIITCSGDSSKYDDLEMLESRTPSDRRRWSFRKRSTQNHVLSNSVTSEPPVIGNDKESQEASHNTFYPSEDSFSFEKISSPKNLDEISHLSPDAVGSEMGGTSLDTEEKIKPDPDVRESASTMIQAAIRGYLARKGMKKLKSVIKLQAAVRGHLVRRQAAGTLRCVHAIIKMQTLIRARFVHRPVEKLVNQRQHDATHEDTKTLESLGKESSGTKHKKTYSLTDKLLTNGFARQLLESMPKTKPIHIDSDPSRSDSAWKWLERWMALASSDIGQQQEHNLNHLYQIQSRNTKLDVSADSQSASVLPALGAQLVINHANDSDFQTPIAIMDECLSPPIKACQECHQPKNDSLDVAQENYTKNKATKESSSFNSSVIIPQSSSVSESPDVTFGKPELEKEKSDCTDSRVECEPLEAEAKKSVLEIRKVCNPAFVAAQSKFKDLCSSGSLKSGSTSDQDVSTGSRLENSLTEYFTKGNVSLKEDSASHVLEGQTPTSECGTELSVSSTVNSPDRSEVEGGEIVLEIGALESRNFDVNGGSTCKKLNDEAKNLSAPETLQPRMPVISHETITNLSAADDSVQMEQQSSPEQHLSEPISSGMLVQQEFMIYEEACKLSPEGSPRRSYLGGLESHETPSSQISLNTNKNGNNENNWHERKQGSQVVGKRSMSNLNDDSSGTSSAEKTLRRGEKRNSVGMPKFGQADHEPRVISSNSLPNYMQTTESARAKVHASKSPKSSPDVHDNDSYTKKRTSLPLGNGKQGSSPLMPQSSSQMQQNAKGNTPRSLRNSAERRWQR